MGTVVAGFAALAKSEQQSPIVRELEDLMPCHIGHPDIVFEIDREAVGQGEGVSAPYAKQAACPPLKAKDGWASDGCLVEHVGIRPLASASFQKKGIVLGIQSHGRHFTEHPVFGKHRPAVNDAVVRVRRVSRRSLTG